MTQNAQPAEIPMETKLEVDPSYLTTQPQVTLVRFGNRAFAMTPWADSLGYAFPVTIKRDALPQVVRLDKLDGRPGRWNDVSGCLQ